jgi:hypothetical protein
MIRFTPLVSKGYQVVDLALTYVVVWSASHCGSVTTYRPPSMSRVLLG